MATGKTYEGANTLTRGVISDIEEQAYKMLYEGLLVPRLCKPVGQGQKGKSIIFPYFDPTAFATAASVLAEQNDFTTYQQLSNASVILSASEFGIASFVTDVVKEDSKVDIPSELARQQAIGVNYKYESHALARLSAGFTTGTTTGSSATTGFSFSHYAAARSKIDGKMLTVPGRKVAVVPTYSWFLTAKSTYAEATSSRTAGTMGGVGDTVVNQYYINSLFGDVDVYRSNYITASSLSVGYMFVRDAVGVWTPRDYRLEKERNASARGDELVSTMRACIKVLIAGYGVRMVMYSKVPTP